MTNKSFFLPVVLSTTLWLQATHAQSTMPLCPDEESVHFFLNRPLPPDPPPGDYTFVLVIKTFVLGFFFETYEYWPENIEVSGHQITFDAPAVEYIYWGIPYPNHSENLGVLAPGTYAVTINPIATNVMPAVACPTITVPLVIPQAYEYVAIPGPTGWLAALLAALLGLCGAAFIGRRPTSR
ncbi:MAG: hypothetical protein ABI451_09360 [Dokdonella sp.]